MPDDFKPEYSRWRHGGWYVDNVRYPSGAVGCIHNNHPDKRWRIVCSNTFGGLSFSTRDDAAKAEKIMVDMMRLAKEGKPCE